jgi:threonine aldolase
VKTIDLRSDSVTRPTQAMRKAMYDAEVGDDGRTSPDGRFGDPTVNELEMRSADLLGLPAALFMPSGTMANLVALRTWCPRGTAVAVGSTAHIYRRETSAFDDAYLGLRPITLADDSGLPDADAVGRALRRDDQERPALLCLENTHNAAGGAAWAPDDSAPIYDTTASTGAPVHLDGARLFNAAVALDCTPADVATRASSVMFCLTKGLGAPLGAVLLGGADFIAHAREVRDRLGGQMRQVGVVAAAGLVALRDFTDQLATDHHRANRLAALLADLPGARVHLGNLHTNIVQLLLPPNCPSPHRLVTDLASHGVLVQATTDRVLRLVTHRDIAETDITRAARVLRDVLAHR